MFLHKYTKAKHGLSYLRNGLLRFSPLPEFNDPFEMRPFIDALGTPEQEQAVIREVEDELGTIPPQIRNKVITEMRTIGLNKLRQRATLDLEATIGILCLVNNHHDDFLMMAHYADSHKGCVLEFDSSHEWFQKKHGNNPHEFMGVLQEVKYSPSRPKGSLIDIGRDHLLTKAKCWEYEREVRMVLNLMDCTTLTQEDREINGLFPVPIEALTNIYLGVNIDSEDRDQFLGEVPRLHSVGLFQFRLHEQEFALVARQVD